jgi:hypothetical protein
MFVRDRRTIALVSLALAASATAGCSQSPPVARADAAAAVASEEPTTEVAPLTGDIRACLGVEAELGHVASGTARWSPQAKPFDKTIAARLRTSSDQLAKQGPQAQSPQVRKVVSGIAESFRSLSAAMAERDRGKVNSAMAQAKVTYKALKTTCELD